MGLHSEIFELLSAIAVDIEKLKKGSTKEISEARDNENPIKRLEKEIIWQRKQVEYFPYFLKKSLRD